MSVVAYCKIHKLNPPSFYTQRTRLGNKPIFSEVQVIDDVKLHGFDLSIQVDSRGNIRFSPASEGVLHPNMKPLFEFEPTDREEEVENANTVEVKSYARKPARRPLPENLLREEVLSDLPEEDKSCPCCGEAMVQMQEKFSEKLHVKPAEFVVKKYITPAYACKKCETMKHAKVPAHPIPKCSVTPETLAYIATSKFVDGMPFHRTEKAFGRHGVEITRYQMARWIVTLGSQLTPLVALLHDKLLSSNLIAMDETYLQVLKEKGGRPDQKNFLPVQAREGPPGQKIILFHYEK